MKPVKSEVMLVKAIEYKFSEGENFESLPIRQLSGTMKITSVTSRQGQTHVAELTAYLPGINSETDGVLNSLSAKGGIFKVTDNASNIHTLGCDQIKASMTIDKKNEGKPGGLYGYELKISYSSPTPIISESFI